jgi:hypothetical protein
MIDYPININSISSPRIYPLILESIWVLIHPSSSTNCKFRSGERDSCNGFGMANSQGIRYSKTSPAFLHANSTSHTWIFSAIAELIDNSYDPDVGAKTLGIDAVEINNVKCLTFKDDGAGLDLDGLHRMLSFGYCDKTEIGGIKPIGHYGNGFKSGSMRLGKDAIVFTKQKETMSVGFLSQTFLKQIGADSVIVPIVSWQTTTRRVSSPEKKKSNETLVL